VPARPRIPVPNGHGCESWGQQYDVRMPRIRTKRGAYRRAIASRVVVVVAYTGFVVAAAILGGWILAIVIGVIDSVSIFIVVWLFRAYLRADPAQLDAPLDPRNRTDFRYLMPGKKADERRKAAAQAGGDVDAVL
jgi:hypothetical protein